MSVSQTAFHDALFDAARPVPEGLTDGQGRPAGRRFAVYRNNVAASLTEALEESFPAMAKLIGAENFRKVAGVFLRRHPPDTPMLAQYGAGFAEFLEGFAPLGHLGYLPDIARLEQARRRAYHAADAAPADPSALQALTPDLLAETRFGLAPATELVASRWPIHAIWAFNMVEGAPKPQPGPQTVLITRPDFDPVLTPVAPGTAAFVTALQAGQPLGAAQDAGLEAEPGFDLAQALSLLLGSRTVTSIRTGGPSP